MRSSERRRWKRKNGSQHSRRESAKEIGRVPRELAWHPAGRSSVVDRGEIKRNAIGPAFGNHGIAIRIGRHRDGPKGAQRSRWASRSRSPKPRSHIAAADFRTYWRPRLRRSADRRKRRTDCSGRRWKTAPRDCRLPWARWAKLRCDCCPYRRHIVDRSHRAKSNAARRAGPRATN